MTTLRAEILEYIDSDDAQDANAGEWVDYILKLIGKRIDKKINMLEKVYQQDTIYNGEEVKHLIVLELEELKKEVLK